MSFSLTTDQVRARTKDVTRRVGWARATPGMKVLAVEKGMGLKKGEKVKPICVIRLVDVRRERLDEIVNPARSLYGQTEMVREGFPEKSPQDFLFMFVAANPHVDPDDLITRIEFEYL